MYNNFFEENPSSSQPTMHSSTPNAKEISGFRSISCVNLKYKLMTKILADRIGMVANVLTSPPNQSAFIGGRLISDNTLLADEMVCGLERIRRTPKRCYVSLDLRKSFDTIKLEAITSIFSALGFPPLFTQIVWNAISSASFSMLIEGFSTPPFKNYRGLRQGEPLTYPL